MEIARQSPASRSGNIPIISNYYFLCQVVHDCRNDSAALYFQYDVSIKNVFDTQVGRLQITNIKYLDKKCCLSLMRVNTSV